MKHTLLLSVFMLFICVHPADVFAADSGPLAAGDYLVYIGEIELERGNINGAIHEFSKALMVEPNNAEALRYLNGLGYESGLYTAHSHYIPPPQTPAMNRMQIVALQMNQVQAQRQMAEQHLASVQSDVCADYYSNIDQRAGIMTLCDGTKKFIPDPWQSGDSFVKYLWDDPAPKGSVKGSTKGSATDFSRGDYIREEAIYNPQSAHIQPSYYSNGSDSQLMSKLRQSYHLEQQYDYEAFLRNQYFISQDEVQNRSEIIDQQHFHLVKLHWELEEAHDEIQHLLRQQEELLNHTTYEVHHMREKGYIE